MRSVPESADLAATNGAGAPTDLTRARAIRRRFIVGGLVVFGLLWALAITYSVTAGGRSPERLDDSEARVVATACRDAQHSLAALPQVGVHATATQNADRVDGENAILTSMVGKFLAVHPAGTDPAAGLRGWTGDWSKLIAARAHYVSDLRTEGDAARFVEPATKGVEPIVNKMNDWILEQGKRTDSCNTGELQAEVIEGPRHYGPGSKT